MGTYFPAICRSLGYIPCDEGGLLRKAGPQCGTFLYKLRVLRLTGDDSQHCRYTNHKEMCGSRKAVWYCCWIRISTLHSNRESKETPTWKFGDAEALSQYICDRHMSAESGKGPMPSFRVSGERQINVHINIHLSTRRIRLLPKHEALKVPAISGSCPKAEN